MTALGFSRAAGRGLKRRPGLRVAEALPLLALAFLVCAAWGGQAAAGELNARELCGLAAHMTQAYEKVNDYITVFYRRGRQGEELCPRETILLKFRKPFSVYMKWIEEPKKGRELLYVQGWNQGNFRISTNSFPDLTLNLDPQGSLVKSDSFGHTLLEVGLGYLVETFAQNLKQSADRPEDGCRVRDLGARRIHGEWARCLEGVYPQGGTGNYYAPRAMLCLSLASGLPVQAVIYDQWGEVVEEFGFARTRINVGLSDRDFDPQNPDYDF